MRLERVWAIAAPVLCLLTTALIVRFTVFSAGMGVPLSWEADALGVYLWAENLERYGMTHALPGLGYPFETSHLEFPVMPNYTYLGTLYIAAILTETPVSAVNLASLLLVSINAGAAYLVIYAITRRPSVALAAGLAFALSFFSMTKLPEHLGVVSYACVPLFFLAIYLLLNVSKSEHSRVLPGAALCAALAAFSNPYLTILSVLAFGGAGFIVTLLSRQWTRMCLILGAGTLTIFVALIVSAPSILYTLQNGVNSSVSLSSTSWQTVELSGLRLSQMITFPSGHRLMDGGSLLAWLSEGRPATEAWASYSLSYLLLGLAGAAYLWFDWAKSSLVIRSSTVLSLTSILLAFLFSSVGGLSDLLVFLLQQLRALSRGVVIIQFACIILAALALNAWIEKVAIGNRLALRGIYCFLVGPAAAVFVVVDQLPHDRTQKTIVASLAFDADQAFFNQVAGELGGFGSADLMQLPYQAFPEFGGPEAMRPHDSLKPFLLIKNARTSAASFPGSNGAFHQMSVQELFRSGQFHALHLEMDARGFEGLIVDRAGLSAYEQRRLQTLMEQSKETIAGGENDRFVFLRPTKWKDAPDAVGRGSFLASYGPISVTLPGINTAPAFSGGVRGFASVDVSPTFALNVNRHQDFAMRAVVQIELTCHKAGLLSVELDDTTSSLGLGPEPQVLNFAVPLPNARNTIEFAFEANDNTVGNSCVLARPAVTFFE